MMGSEEGKERVRICLDSISHTLRDQYLGPADMRDWQTLKDVVFLASFRDCARTTGKPEIIHNLKARLREVRWIVDENRRGC
jgi:hypothetical protein